MVDGTHRLAMLHVRNMSFEPTESIPAALKWRMMMEAGRKPLLTSPYPMHLPISCKSSLHQGSQKGPPLMCGFLPRIQVVTP